MKPEAYTVCPGCNHPNIHVAGGIIEPHTVSTVDPTPCPAAGKPAPEQRTKPLPPCGSRRAWQSAACPARRLDCQACRDCDTHERKRLTPGA